MEVGQGQIWGLWRQKGEKYHVQSPMVAPIEFINNFNISYSHLPMLSNSSIFLFPLDVPSLLCLDNSTLLFKLALQLLQRSSISYNTASPSNGLSPIIVISYSLYN
jgi:hypothetical protein